MYYRPLSSNVSDQTNNANEDNVYFSGSQYQNVPYTQNSSSNKYPNQIPSYTNSGGFTNFQYPSFNSNYPPTQAQTKISDFSKKNYDIASQQRQYVIPDEVVVQKQQQKQNFKPASETNSTQTPVDQGEVKFVIHKVDFVDTLDGLSLQYGVSKVAIRNFNNLVDDNIYYLKTLKIPNPSATENYTADYDEEELDRIRKQQKLQVFEGFLDKEDHKAAKYYLEENEWDVTKALKNYKADLEFEKQYINAQKMNNGLLQKKLR